MIAQHMQATRLISRKERKKLMDCGAEVCRNVTPERFFSPRWGIADGYTRRRKEAAERQPPGKHASAYTAKNRIISLTAIAENAMASALVVEAGYEISTCPACGIE